MQHLSDIPTSGWIPRGRGSQDGYLVVEVSEADVRKYCLVEAYDWKYPQITEWNIRDSCGTVIFGNITSRGCTLTIRLCIKLHKPYICNPTVSKLKAWIIVNGISILNVAGNREETNPGIYLRTYNLLVAVLRYTLKL